MMTSSQSNPFNSGRSSDWDVDNPGGDDDDNSDDNDRDEDTEGNDNGGGEDNGDGQNKFGW